MMGIRDFNLALTLQRLGVQSSLAEAPGGHHLRVLEAAGGARLLGPGQRPGAGRQREPQRHSGHDHVHGQSHIWKEIHHLVNYSELRKREALQTGACADGRLTRE